MDKKIKEKRHFNKRSLRYGTNSVVLIIVVLAIAVVLNMLVGIKPLKLDLTPNKLYTIGDTTKDILKGLAKDITIYGLVDDSKVNSDQDLKAVVELLNQYGKYDHIKIEYVDPDKNPGFIKTLDPDNLKNIQKGDYVFVCGSKMKVVANMDLYDISYDQANYQPYKNGLKAEQSFSGAIKYVTSDNTPAVYFTEGHDELKPDSDLTTLRDYLGRNNYEVKTVNLATEVNVPADAEILIVASPKKDLARSERDKIENYIKNGGNTVFLFDSLDTNPTLSEFDELLKLNNMSLNYDRVKENDAKRYYPPNRYYDIFPITQSNSINQLLGDSFVMVISKARSINILKNTKDYIKTTSLMKTSEKAVGEQIEKTKGADIQGPLDIAVAAENGGYTKPSKMLVIGNASFITDSALKQADYAVNGMYFFLNSLSWMQGTKDNLIIAPKAYETRTLQMTARESNIVIVCVLIVLPLLILGAGTFVWMRRRHL